MMEELYQEIENRILAAGYLKKVDGLEIYEQISDQIEGKENLISCPDNDGYSSASTLL